MTWVTLCVDAIAPEPGGIGRYTWELAKGLSNRSDLSVQYYGHHRMIEDPALLLRGESLPRRPNKLRRWWDRRLLKASLVHGPNYFLPAFAERGIITVHDLSVFHYPETHPVKRIKAFEREFLKSLSRATHVITDTEKVRAEVIDMFSLPAERITAIPLGVEPAFGPLSVERIAGRMAQLGLTPGRYGLCVSTIEPRKKIAELLTAWRLLPSAIRNAYPLVLCGGAGWRNTDLLAMIEHGIGEGWLRHLGYVEEGLLPILYAGAALFIYPSIYEGFGLPPVEAMACGVPVIVSDRSCLREVCGDAPRYINPDDIGAFTLTIADILEDRGWQDAAIRRGLARARQFTWRHCVDSTAELYVAYG